MKTITLFGEKYFTDYAHERFGAIASEINSITDAEILKQEEELNALSLSLESKYKKNPLNISFEKERVKVYDPYLKTSSQFDPFRRQTVTPTWAVVRYGIPVISGDGDMLSVTPFSHVTTAYAAEFKEGYIEFEYNTRYSNTALPDSKIQEAKNYARQVQDFIMHNAVSLNTAIEEYNNKLKEYILPRLQKRLVTAKQNIQRKSDLNPF